MVDSIKKLQAYLRKFPHDFVPSTLEFMSFDLKKLKLDMDLTERGRKRGAVNIPPPKSTAFDEVEMEIIDRIQTQLKVDRQVYDSTMSAYGQRLYGLGLQEYVSEIKTLALGALAEFRLEVTKGRDALYDRRRDVVQFDVAFEDFKRTHALNRPASYPEHRWYHYGFVAVIFLVETGINGGLFAIGHLGGILGGVVEAILVSVINVFFLGMLIAPAAWRLAHHWRFHARIAGMLGVVLFMVAALGFNLFVAHYRDAFEGITPGEAGHVALRTFTSSPLELAEPSSWMLWALGVFFALLAAVDGVKLDDVYPGYGRRDRDRRERNLSYRRTKEALLDALGEVRDGAIAAMQQAMGELEKRRAEFLQAGEGRARFTARFREHLKYLEDAANNLLMTYRDANRSVRGKKAAPRHFGERWHIGVGADTETPDVPPVNDTEIKTLIAETTSTLDDAIRRVHEAYNGAITQYERIEEMTSGEFRHGA